MDKIDWEKRSKTLAKDNIELITDNASLKIENKELTKQCNIPSVMQWVDCKEELPNHEEIILVHTYTGIDIYQFLDDQFYHYENGYVQNDVVTHWMHLPKPPCA